MSWLLPSLLPPLLRSLRPAKVGSASDQIRSVKNRPSLIVCTFSSQRHADLGVSSCSLLNHAHVAIVSFFSTPFQKSLDHELISLSFAPSKWLQTSSWLACAYNRPFAQLWPGTRFGASQARIGCVVCVSHLSFRFLFCFGMLFSEHCCVPRFSNRGRASPSLFSHWFSRSSELRKRWLLAIRQAVWSHFRVPNSTVVCNEHVLPEKKVRFHARA